MTAGLWDLTWPEVRRGSTAVVPVGSVEQHGPHLPFDTDTAIAVAVAAGAAERVGDCLVTPALAFGSSGEHQSFAGTCSIGTDALRLVLVELVRSLSTWAGRVLLVNGHGGNVTALAGAVGQLREEQHDVAWAACATEVGEREDLHAGRLETSLMLHLRPDAVRLERAETGDLRSLREILPTLMVGGVAAVSANGVLGDPAGASADEGARLLEDLVADVVRRVRDWAPDPRGRLVPTPARSAP